MKIRSSFYKFTPTQTAISYAAPNTYISILSICWCFFSGKILINTIFFSLAGG